MSVPRVPRSVALQKVGQFPPVFLEYEGERAIRGEGQPSRGGAVRAAHTVDAGPQQAPAMKPRRKYTYRRLVQGRRPREYEHPVLVAVFSGFPCPLAGELGLETWQLWLRTARSTSSAWWNMKLCAAAENGELAGVAYLKANYWLGWHSVERRFPVRSSDHGKLRDGRPDLHRALCETLEGPIGEKIGVIAKAVRMRDGFAPQGQFPVVSPTFVCRWDHGAGGNAYLGPSGPREHGIAPMHPHAARKAPVGVHGGEGTHPPSPGPARDLRPLYSGLAGMGCGEGVSAEIVADPDEDLL